MAEQHGGYRRPSNPSPVPMPGALSRRTDGGPAQTTVPMTGAAYGENADYNDIQSSAPLAAAPSVPNARMRNSDPTGRSAAATPLFSPTGRPDEPVTAGAPVGPGPGMSVPKPTPSVMQQDLDTIKRFLPDLEEATGFANAPQSFKNLVNYLRNA